MIVILLLDQACNLKDSVLLTTCLYDIAALQVTLAKCSLHIENLSMMELFLGRVRSLC